MEPVKIGLVGVGGYAKSYVRSIRTLENEDMVELKSVVIRSPHKYPGKIKEMTNCGVSIRASFDEMLARDAGSLELVGIPTSIDSHRDLMIRAAEAGLNVILEKPSAATIQDLNEMQAALDRAGTFCQIGFQSQSNPLVLGLKEEICSGRLGRIKEVVTTGCWRRGESYFLRNSWSGRFMVDGRYVLDGTTNNPLAHYLFNSLFFASQERNQAALPVSVRAELYHAHDIQSEDTSCLEIVCDNGANVYFYATLCAHEGAPTTTEVIGDNGRARWVSDGPARLFEGERQTKEIAKPETAPNLEVFRNAVLYLRGVYSRLNCPLEMTRAHVLAVNGAFESTRRPTSIPKDHLNPWREEETGDRYRDIVDIEDIIRRAAAERRLFSDLGVPWAVKTKPFSLEGYGKFEIQPMQR